MRALLFLGILLLSLDLSAQMVLSGSATGSCDCYELTDDTAESGSVWSPGTISLANPFDFSFEVNLGVDDVWGADGMTFAMRQSGTSPGGIGRFLGYGTIPNSVAVEIDTWNSSPAVVTDIADDHLGMNSAGGVEHDLVAPIIIANIEDGIYHTFRVTWDPVAFDFEVFLDGTSIFVYTGDMTTLFFGGNPDVYFGWTGGTGGVDNIQSVCMYREADFSADLTTVCVGQEVSFTDESTSDLIYNLEEAVTWSWDFGDGSTSLLQNPTHSYAADGIYTVSLTITDVSGCSSVETLEITVTPPLDVDVVHTDVTCFGLNDGTATATTVSGTGPYTYLWDDALSQAVSTAVDLSPDSYNVVVTDALGCTGTASVIITEPTELLIDSAIPTNASCGLANGSITINASGGTPGLEYSIDGGATFVASNIFPGLINASYAVVVRDANGCEVTTTTIVALDSPLVIDDVVVTAQSCAPLPDGTITINASAGAPAFQYSIDGGASYQASNFFDNLTAGTYTVFVLDDVGCSVSETVIVPSLSTVVIDDVDFINLTCNGGADGELEIFASGGVAPYEYSIDAGVSFFPTNNFSGLSAGIYDIEVMDSGGCVQTESVTLTAPPIINFDAVDVTDISCNGLFDGAIEITASGGTPGYLYSSDNGLTFQVSSLFTGLPEGVYDLVIKDANDCEVNTTATIIEPSPVVIDDVIITDVTCNGLSDGEATVVASGGNPTYTYSVDGGAFQVSPLFTGLGAGSIDIEVLDVNGCSVTGTAFLSESDPLLLTLGADTTICLGGEAVLCPTVLGGTWPYTYTWDGVVGAACLTTSVIGMHELQVEDANGCTSTLENQIVDLYTPITVTTTSSATICSGEPVTIAGDAAGDGPDGGFTYTWSNSTDGTILDGPVQVVAPEMSTTYTLTVSTGCENTASSTVIISTYPVPPVSAIADVYEGCEDLTVQFQSTTPGALVVATTWDFGNGVSAEGVAPSITYFDADCYNVELEIETVDGCIVSEVFEDYICVWKRPIADFTFEPAQPDLFNLTVDFENESLDASTFIWTFGDGHASGEYNPAHTYPELGNRTYPVELIAISDKGCEASITKNVTIDDVVLYYIPNAFTPTGDLFNQTFNPVFLPGFFPADYNLKIFNRWGELMYESYDQTAGWDGTYGDELVPDGVYVWELTFRENKTDVKKREFGHVTVLK